MWKKDEATPSQPPVEGAQRADTNKRTTSTERATIGRSITIRGEVSGDEDLLIQGRVEGSVELDQHTVTVGREGRVKANVSGRVVTIEGQVDGDLTAHEQIVLRSSARVQGDIRAPRVVLEDGASFRGLVDMGEPAKPEEAARPTTAGSSVGGAVTGAPKVPATTRSGGVGSAKTGNLSEAVEKAST